MRSIRLFLLLGIFILFPGIAGAQGLTVKVAADTIVTGPQIILGEVAEIEGDDPARVETLSQMNLGQTPPPGQSITLSMETFGARLLNSKGADLSGIDWQVPPYVKITSASQKLSGDKIVAEAQNYIFSQFKGQSADDLIVSPIGKQNDLALPPGDVSLTVSAPQGIRFGGPAGINVNVSVNGQLITTARVRFQVDLFEEVVVTVQPISSGTTLTLDNLKMERRNLSRSNSSLEFITDINKVLGLAARRSVGTGIILDSSMITKPVILQRGQTVTIVAQRGGIEIRTSGVARQDGYEGQLIRVQNIDSKKMLSAKVINSETVRVF